MTELLAPAGDLEKLKTALRYGADAAYIGGKQFSLRSGANNCTESELTEAVRFAHAQGKKIYVAANIFARNADLAPLGEYFEFLQSIGADAAIVSDAGAFSVARKCAPRLPLHISTQANITNAAAVRFWHEQGASRVVLARELSLAEIAHIARACRTAELEVFVHGAMCISYSGRCLLSHYLAGRDANRGACVQACRWKFRLRAENAPGTGELTAEEDGRGTYLLNSRDLNLIRRLGELTEAGVCSFKIEGRMKSAYYLATVVGAYRRVLDGKMSAREGMEELGKAAHRAYTEAFFEGENAESELFGDSQEAGTAEYIADVLEGGVRPLVQMRNRFRIGDTLEVLSPGGSHNARFVLEEMTDADGAPVADAKRVMQALRIRCPVPLSAGDMLRRPVQAKP